MSELYQLPNLIYFESYEHLLWLLRELSDPAHQGSSWKRVTSRDFFREISQQMRRDTEHYVNATHMRVARVLEHMLT
eukprot:5938177-Pyramimonas_sp.AAC.1